MTIKDHGKVYDGELPTVASVLNTDWELKEAAPYTDFDASKLNISLSMASGASADAGEYGILGTDNDSNHAITFYPEGSDTAGNGKFTVTPRPINVTIKGSSGVYGDDHGKAVDGAVNTLLDPEATGNKCGLAPNEDLDDIGTILLDTDATATSDVGPSYTIYAVDNQGDKITTATRYDNYVVTFITDNATFTVNKRPITVTINDQDSYYGLSHTIDQDGFTISDNNTTVQGDLQSGTLDFELAVNGASGISAASNAGKYSITATPKGGKLGNYTITFVGETPWNADDADAEDTTPSSTEKGTYTINKAALSATLYRTNIFTQYQETIQNPLTFTNSSIVSAGQGSGEIATGSADYQALSAQVSYEMDPSNGLTMQGTDKAAVYSPLMCRRLPSLSQSLSQKVKTSRLTAAL